MYTSAPFCQVASPIRSLLFVFCLLLLPQTQPCFAQQIERPLSSFTSEKQAAEAKPLLEALQLQVDPGQVGALQEAGGHFYERYAQLLLKRHQPEEALEMLESGRGQGLARQRSLAERGDITRFFSEQEKTTLLEKSRALREALALQRQAEQEAENAPPAERQARRQQADLAREQAQTAEREYALFRDALFARYPQLRQPAPDPRPDFSHLKTLAREHPDTLYLEWGRVDERTTLLFALGAADGLKPLTLSLNLRELSKNIAKWRATMEKASGKAAGNVSTAERNRAQAEEEALAKQLYQMLLGEVEKAGLLADGRYIRLVLVEEEPLLKIPFAALMDGNGRRLIERYTLSSAISLNSFFQHPNGIAPTKSLLCIAAPADKQGKAIPAPKSGPNLAPLPFAREEGEAIHRLFSSTTSMLLTGSRADPETVRKQIEQYSVLHFATPGLSGDQTGQRSTLILAAPSGSKEKYGLLQASDILAMRLSAQMVVLSAYPMEQERPMGGEGLMGLAWAFQAAGCPSVVASLWTLPDQARSDLMIAFYKQLKAGKSKDEALRTAMLGVMHDGKKQHRTPYYWAAFQVIGNASALSR